MTSPEPGPDSSRILSHVHALEGERHPDSSPERLEAALRYTETMLAGTGAVVERVPYQFAGRTFHNVVARIPGERPELPRVLVGAHVDTVRGSPGADDNASAVAVLLEVAELLRGRRLRRTVEFVVFTLEERQGLTYRVGSRRWTARARAGGVRYAGALILEMVGYRDPRPGSQRVPFLLRWKRISDTGDFLAAVGDGQSRHLLQQFEECAARAAPDLPIVSLLSPLRGWLVWATRRSDNASFWSEGYPALMLTDTSFLRNPHYHRASDQAGTLDAEFMAQVAAAVLRTVRRVAAEVGGEAGGGPGGDDAEDPHPVEPGTRG